MHALSFSIYLPGEVSVEMSESFSQECSSRTFQSVITQVEMRDGGIIPQHSRQHLHTISGDSITARENNSLSLNHAL